MGGARGVSGRCPFSVCATAHPSACGSECRWLRAAEGSARSAYLQTFLPGPGSLSARPRLPLVFRGLTPPRCATLLTPAGPAVFLESGAHLSAFRWAVLQEPSSRPLSSLPRPFRSADSPVRQALCLSPVPMFYLRHFMGFRSLKLPSNFSVRLLFTGFRPPGVSRALRGLINTVFNYGRVLGVMQQLCFTVPLLNRKVVFHFCFSYYRNYSDKCLWATLLSLFCI